MINMKYFNYTVIGFVLILNLPYDLYSDFETFKNAYSIIYCDNCFKQDTLVVYNTEASSGSTGSTMNSDENSVDFGYLKSNHKKKQISYRNDFPPKQIIKNDTITLDVVYYSKLNDYVLFRRIPPSIWNVNLKYVITPLLYLYSIIAIIYYLIFIPLKKLIQKQTHK